MDKLAEVLASLREERKRIAAELSRIDHVIEALEEATGTADRAAVAAAPPAAAAPAATPYAKLDLYEATAAYLATVKEPKNSRQIADALRAGGFKTRSQHFTGTVRTMLRRSPASRAGIRATSDGTRWFVRPKR